MPRYTRDPLSEWFDGAAAGWVARAYRKPGQWEVTYLAPPSQARRLQAAVELGIANLDERDRWGERRWTRAFKRAVYHVHKEYGYAGEFRPCEPRVSDSAGTALKWQTRGLVRKEGWPTRRLELAIMIVPGGDAALAAAGHGTPAARRYTAPQGEAFRSKPAPPDRPWEPGF